MIGMINPLFANLPCGSVVRPPPGARLNRIRLSFLPSHWLHAKVAQNDRHRPDS
jgi:hypothetical protein